MNPEIIQSLTNEAMVYGIFMGAFLAIAVSGLVNLAWSSRQRREDRMCRLEDELRKMRTTIDILEIRTQPSKEV